MQYPVRSFFGGKKAKEAEKVEQAEKAVKAEKEQKTESKAASEDKKEDAKPEEAKEEPLKKAKDSSKSEPEADTTDELSRTDVKKIKALFQEQEVEIEKMKKDLDEERAKLSKGEKEMKLFRIEYTKQVRENEDTVKRYRKMIEDEKQFAITKFAKDLLEVRDAMRFALENTDKEAVMAETELQVVKDKYAANLEGQVMTADVMDKVLARFSMEQYDPKGKVFDPTLHEAVFTVKDSELDNNFIAITMSTGWKIGERILRAAKVGIVKK